MCGLYASNHCPRAKIDAIVRRGDGIPDEDAPLDPESVRFWAFTTGHYKELEKVSLSGTAKTNVKPTVDGVTSLLDGQSMPSACAASPATGSGTLSLTSLVDVMKDSVNTAGATTPGQGRAKSKAKAKAKARAVEPTTVKEKKEAARAFHGSGVFFCFCFCPDWGVAFSPMGTFQKVSPPQPLSYPREGAQEGDEQLLGAL